ncbi:hypothetical protein [Haladaptatus sp. NG-SE-30]
MTRKVERRRLDAFQQRIEIPRSWALTISAVVIIGVFAATWLAGSSLWLVAIYTLVAALVTPVGLAILGTAFRFRTFDILAHVLLGLFVSAVALIITLLSVAEGALGASLYSVVLGSFWAIGIALVVAGILVFAEAHRRLRLVAIFGLTVAVIWGLMLAVFLGGLVIDIALGGIGDALGHDLRDDLIPFLVIFGSLVILPSFVFFRDLRETRGQRQNDD